VSKNGVNNYLALSENIPVNSEIPFDKLLIGALCNLWNRVSQHLMKSEVVPTITGPWRLLQLWLELHLQKLVGPELINLSFPSLEYSEEQEEQPSKSQKFCRCTSFSKAALAITINGSTTYFFKLFYRNYPEGVLD
jgi:hypothetical protein